MFLMTMPEAEKLRGKKHFPEDTKPTGKMFSDSLLISPGLI
jgi:carbohydrate 3-sulfotransferase 10